MNMNDECLICKTHLSYPQNYHARLPLKAKDYLTCEKYCKASLSDPESWTKKLHHEMRWRKACQ
jgi:hypothetical protein